MVDGKEQPVLFMSKSLTATEQRWTTVEQECYAIYLCFRKYEYLLRDIKFTLKTDHANLLYINVPPSSKVLRWKLAIQEYNFDAAHVPGLQNVVADSFSRLVEAKKVPLADVLALRKRKGGGKSTDSVLEDLRLPDDVYDTIARVHNSWMGLWRYRCHSQTIARRRRFLEKYPERCCSIHSTMPIMSKVKCS